MLAMLARCVFWLLLFILNVVLVINTDETFKECLTYGLLFSKQGLTKCSHQVGFRLRWLIDSSMSHVFFVLFLWNKRWRTSQPWRCRCWLSIYVWFKEAVLKTPHTFFHLTLMSPPLTALRSVDAPVWKTWNFIILLQSVDLMNSKFQLIYQKNPNAHISSLSQDN